MNPAPRPLRALVTGGGGFLGRRIVEMLLARGDEVRSFSRGTYPDLAAAGVECVAGDLADAGAVAKACSGRDIVFHVASKAGVWGRHDDYYRPNVLGTQHVIAGCRTHGVPRLVYTSSPSVIFDGSDMEGVAESVPYPRHYTAHYPATKAAAERLVLAANGPALATISLRPHLIWGPRDNHLVPRIIARASSLRRIGNINKPVDCTYIDNAAEAHLLACDRLHPGASVAGRAYFISQGDPRGVWDLVDDILAAAGRPKVSRSIPRPLAVAVAAGIETAYRLLNIVREPRLTRFLIEELTTAHWFDISAARRELGYDPSVSIEQGLERLRAWFQQV